MVVGGEKLNIWCVDNFDRVGEAADASADGNADGGEAQQGTGQESSGASPHKDASPAPDTSSNLNSTANTGPDHALSPDSAKNSSGKLMIAVVGF